MSFSSYKSAQTIFSSKNLNGQGFTLVEFLVAISIGVVILGTVASSQSKYTDAAALKGLVNDISLSLRQAQVYGISVKEFTPGEGDFKSAYGLSFNADYQSSYISFADRGVKNGVYDGSFATCVTGGSANECISLVPITRGNRLLSLCTIALDNSENYCSVGRTHITFVRPATEATIVSYNTSGALISPSTYKGIKINFVSPAGANRSIKVYNTGQIAVQ